MKKYPDMSRLFALKEERRRKLANLPIPEKMEIAQHLQDIGRDAPGHRAAAGAKWRLVTLRAKKKRTKHAA